MKKTAGSGFNQNAGTAGAGDTLHSNFGLAKQDQAEQDVGERFRQIHRIFEPYTAQDQYSMLGEFQGKFLVRNKVEQPTKKAK